MAVIAAFELHDPIASSRGARDAHRGHRGFGPARNEPDEVDPRERVHDPPRELDLAFGGRSEGRALGRCRTCRRDDLGVGVAEQQRPPRADEVDVPAPVDVDHVRAFATVEEPRGAPDRAERPNGRVDATRDHRSRANEELLGKARREIGDQSKHAAIIRGGAQSRTASRRAPRR